MVALGSVLAGLIFTPLAGRLSFRLGIVAQPGGRRRHTGSIPKLGGLAVFAAWLVGIGLTYWLLPPANPADALRLRGWFSAAWSSSWGACSTIATTCRPWRNC